MERVALVAWVLLLSSLLGCQRASDAKLVPEQNTSTVPRPEKLAVANLPNAYRIHPRVIAGGLPEGEAAFQELAALGVKTVVSVDGAKPDVELARRHGMRYVHLPHGYDGIPQGRALELAAAVRDLPGPIYIHCHHGKHRSPAAAAVACVGTGLLQPADGLAVLAAAGTSPNYRGLFASVEQARRFAGSTLDAAPHEFPATAELPPLAMAMVEIEHSFDRLKQIAGGRWKPPADHPDLDPAHEALLLREQFTELLRTEETGQQPQRFRELLVEAEAAAQQLETTLREPLAADNSTGVADAKKSAALNSFERITKNCATCHREFRDVPLSEKPLLHAPNPKE